MTENQSISKKQRMDFQPGHDRLSELPLSIIHIILALVPIRDAVKTSILSRQWRYTWTSLSHLGFKEHCRIRDYLSRDKFEDRMENFITHVLVLHKGPIYKFKLSVPFRRCCQNIGVWLLCLFRNDIRELILDMGRRDSSRTLKLNSTIYSCKKLAKLKLYNCTLDHPPSTFKAFLLLRSLRLREVYLPTNGVESLVANCPLLEDFKSINCGNSELRISAPNLKFLYLVDDFIVMSVYAPLLAELRVILRDCGFRFNHRQHHSSVCYYTYFMGGFTNLEKLSGHFYFIKHLGMGIDSCHHTLIFHRLKDIELDEVNFTDIKDISVVARLVVGAPNLQKLKLANLSDIDGDDDASGVPYVSFSDFGCAPNFKFEKLRVVKMWYHVRDLHPLGIEFFKFLLERSSVLETMSFGGLFTKQEQNLSAALQRCSWASPNAKLAMTYSWSFFSDGA